jgi:two-component system response regulator DesR
MSAEGPIRVLIADDQAIIREALAALIRLEPDIEVVGLAADSAMIIALAAEHEPDVILMDVQMAGDSSGIEPRDGIEATARIVRTRPAIRVIILTTFGRPGYLRRAMEAGAVGFMVKDSPADRLVEGIRRVHAGLRVVDPTLAADSLSIGASPLTERETEVLAAASQGGSTATIASVVFLSEGTVRNHLSSAMGKLGAGSRAEAVRIATDNGWLG